MTIQWFFSRKKIIVRSIVMLVVLYGIYWLFQERVEYSIFSVLYGEKPVAKSKWDARDRDLFSNVLSAQHYDVLVVPFQTKGLSTDRISRSVMTRMFSERLSESGIKTPDPSLVMRALGAKDRTYNFDDVLHLAQKIGTQRIVEGFVTRNQSNSKWTLELARWSFDKSSGHWQEDLEKPILNISMSDDLPPEAAFQALVDDSVKGLFPALSLSENSSVRAEIKDQLVSQPKLLARNLPVSGIERALDLQLFAAFYPDSELEGEYLWERSLIALLHAGQDEPYAKLLRGRAYYHLGRRPYAMNILGTPGTPEEKAFYSVIQGNLPQAEKDIDSIKNEGLRLIAMIESETLHLAYNDTHGYDKRRAAIFEKYPSYYPVMALRFSGGDWFNPELHSVVRNILIQESPEALPMDSCYYLHYAWYITKFLYWHVDELNSFTASTVEEGYRNLWLSRAVSWTGTKASDRLSEKDYFELLYAVNREAAVKTAIGLNSYQARPWAVLSYSDDLFGPLANYPWLQYEKAYARYQIGDKKGGDLRYRDWVQSSKLARDVYVWEGGESVLSLNAEYLIDLHPFEKYNDEPMRSYRTVIEHKLITTINPNPSQEQLSREISELKRRLRYTTTDADILNKLVKDLKWAGKTDEAEKVIEANSGRFKVTSSKTLVADAQLKPLDAKALEAKYRSDVEAEPEEWPHYIKLGELLISQERPQEAQQLFASYPLFREDRNVNPVGLSHNAYAAGILLAIRGYPDFAKPFFELSIRYHTGSGSEMKSEEILAYMRKDYQTAMQWAKKGLDRYGDEYSASAYSVYLFMTGSPDKAWAQFQPNFLRYVSVTPWFDALYGHRMAGSSNEEIRKWAYSVKYNETIANYALTLRNHFLFVALFTDREVDDKAMAIIKDTGKDANTFYAKLAVGFNAIRTGDDKRSISFLTPVSETEIIVSAEKKQSLNYVLPYLALAHARLGTVDVFKTLLEKHRVRVGEDFDYFLALAFIAAYAGDDPTALNHLKHAYYILPPTETRPVYTGYQLLETCETLYLKSKNDAYRALLVNLAHKMNTYFPFPWKAAFEAKYTDSAEARKEALRIAIKLDPLSMRVASLPEKDRNEAKKWLSENKLFN